MRLIILIILTFIISVLKADPDSVLTNDLRDFNKLYSRTFLEQSIKPDKLSHEVFDRSLITRDTVNLIKSSIYIAISELSTENPDSAEKFLQSALNYSIAINNLSLQIQSLNGLGKHYYLRNNYNKSLKFLKESEKLLSVISDKNLVVQTYYLIAKTYTKTIDRNKALIYAGKVIENTEELSPFLTRTYALISIMYRDTMDMERAMEYLMKSIKLSEELGDWKRTAYNYVLLAGYAVNYYDFEQAIHYYNKAIEINKANKYLLGTAYTYMNFGSAYFNQGNYKKAMEYNKIALKHFEQLNDKHYLAFTNNNIGEIFFNTGSIDSAEVYVKAALEYALSSNNQIAISNAYHSLGKIAESGNRLEEAIAYYKESAEGDHFATLLNNYKKLSDIYTNINYPDSALKYLKLHDTIEDSISTANAQQFIIDSQIKYDVEKKVNALKAARAENSSLEKELETSNTITMILMLSGFVIIGFVFFYYRNKTVEFIQKIVPDSNETLNDRRKYRNVIRAIEKSNGDTDKSNWAEDPTAKDIILRLEKIMTEEKIFMNPKLTQVETAERLKTNTTYLSRAINLKYNLNFSNFINKYRIGEAQKIISGDSEKIYTFDGIAKTVGFTSKSAFYSAFKKFTGKTPSQFSYHIHNKK